jgi:hypothetical protein
MWSVFCVVLCAASFAVASCSGQKGLPGSIAASSTSTSTTLVAVSNEAEIGKPPPLRSADIEGSKLVAKNPAVGAWITSVTTAKLDGCTSVPSTLEAEVALQISAVPDAVLSELLLNLDGAIGGARLACQSADGQRATAELGDARSLVAAVKQRLEELG